MFDPWAPWYLDIDCRSSKSRLSNSFWKLVQTLEMVCIILICHIILCCFILRLFVLLLLEGSIKRQNDICVFHRVSHVFNFGLIFFKLCSFLLQRKDKEKKKMTEYIVSTLVFLFFKRIYGKSWATLKQHFRALVTECTLSTCIYLTKVPALPSLPQKCLSEDGDKRILYTDSPK